MGTTSGIFDENLIVYLQLGHLTLIVLLLHLVIVKSF